MATRSGSMSTVNDARKRYAWVLAVFGMALMAMTSEASITPVRLTIEHATEPLDVDVPQPRFSWQLNGERGDVVQRAYQIVVASQPAAIRSGRADVWDSGKMDSAVQIDVPYAGPALQSNATYFWSVRVWTTDGGSPGAWSEPARFDTGFLSPSDWTAAWIGRDEPATVPSNGAQARAPLLRKEFALEKPIVRARLRIVGLGRYVACFNGRRVGERGARSGADGVR